MLSCPSHECVIFLGLDDTGRVGQVARALQASGMLARTTKVQYIGNGEQCLGLDIAFLRVPGVPPTVGHDEKVLGLARKLLPLAGQKSCSVTCGSLTYLVTENDQWPPKA